MMHWRGNLIFNLALNFFDTLAEKILKARKAF